MNTRETVLISAAELTARIDSGDAITILDVRWRLDEPDGPRRVSARAHTRRGLRVTRGRADRPHTRRTRTPPASVGTQRRDIRATLGNPGRRAHRRLRRLESRRFVASMVGADRGGHQRCAHLGRRPVSLAVGRRRLATGVVTPPPGNVAVVHNDLYAGALPTLTAQQADRCRGDLLDARAPGRFRGESSRSIASPVIFPAQRIFPAAKCSAADGTFIETARAQPAAFRSRHRARRAGRCLLRLGCHRHHHTRGTRHDGIPRGVVSGVVVGMEFGSVPCRGAGIRVADNDYKVCQWPPTVMRLGRWARWSTCVFT